MKRMSKSRDRADEAREFRESLFAAVSACELCRRTPARMKWGNLGLPLHEHHIARGIHRSKAKGKRFAVLVLCYDCHINRIHNGKEHWPEARQLCILRRSRPADFSLDKYNRLVGYGPNRVSIEDVDAWAVETPSHTKETG